ncbi:MAG: hypothetical protein KF785_15190 [Gemmatimonadales bacterium]|nr:hypothetical protein [Gemmatimonadales bacterium]
MVSLASLWLPILVSAVAVFIASSVIHMVLTYHNSDVRRVPDEDGVRAALRPFAIPPGDYVMPRAQSSAEMRSAEYLEKLNQGPVIQMTVMPNGMFNIGKQLGQWFIFCIVVGIFAAYVAGHVLPPGEAYLRVFRITGAVAFAGYGLAQIQQSIWFNRSWTTTLKSLFDALIFAALTGGVFGWRWPAA